MDKKSKSIELKNLFIKLIKKNIKKIPIKSKKKY